MHQVPPRELFSQPAENRQANNRLIFLAPPLGFASIRFIGLSGTKLLFVRSITSCAESYVILPPVLGDVHHIRFRGPIDVPISVPRVMQASSLSFLGAEVSRVTCRTQTFALALKAAVKCRITGSASPPTKHNRTPAEMDKRMLGQEPNTPRRPKRRPSPA
jgi:hypothetical protein